MSLAYIMEMRRRVNCESCRSLLRVIDCDGYEVDQLCAKDSSVQPEMDETVELRELQCHSDYHEREWEEDCEIDY